MGEYRLSDLLDLSILHKMADAHHHAAGMPIGIIDAFDGSILVGAGWQDICTKFHRAHPAALHRCNESDDYIKGRLVEGQACGYKCQNGLWDIGIPIVVGREHLATMFLGQFFYEGEVPDRRFFEEQAVEFGFDVDDYLAALDKVPTFSREKVDYVLEYDKALVSFISDLAGHALQKREADAERKLVERALKRQARFLQELIDAMPYPVFYKNTGGKYLGCNRAFEQFYGLSRERLAGRTVYDLSSPRELADRYYEADRELLAHPGTQMYEASVRSSDGVYHDALFHKATFEGPDGLPAGIVGVVVDITERKRAEEDRQRLQDQLAVSQKMESIGRLAGGVAHDFNNMLSIILGYAELILSNLNTEDSLHHEVKQIHIAAERSRDVTRQLLAFARKEITTPKVLDLNASVEGTLKMLRRLIGENIHLAWHPGKDLGPVFIDPSQLDQILANLCVNARDAIADVGNIVIETHSVTFDSFFCALHPEVSPGEYVTLSVSDDGCGMDRDTLDNVFEPFFTTKGVGRGTGLGLATVYGIVKQNSGGVEVYSELGQGTTFRIFLPRHGDGLHEESVPQAQEAPAGRGETVMVVEDEPSILELAELVLRNHNFEVITASSPSQALRRAEARAGGIALLITDVVMPEMNGRELSDRLQDLYPDLRCLYMSGYTANAIVERGLLDREGQFIQKPWSPRDLISKVVSVLNGGDAPS